jgi:hypothetical protein
MHHAGARGRLIGCHATVGETGILCGLELVQEAQSVVAHLVSRYISHELIGLTLRRFVSPKGDRKYEAIVSCVYTTARARRMSI